MFKLTFKVDVNPRDLTRITQKAQILFAEVLHYFVTHNLPLKVTSLITDREFIKSKSTTHEDGRAFDVGVAGMSVDEVTDVVLFFNKHFANIAAISSTDNKPRAVVYGDSRHLDHMHFQVRRA